MTRRLRCYVAAPRSLARSVVQIHTMLEDHDIKPTSLWADGVLAAIGNDAREDSALEPHRARQILDDNRSAINASDVLFAYLPGWLTDPTGDSNGSPLWPTYPKETYCELEAARAAGKFIVIVGSKDMVPLSILVACHDGDARMAYSVTSAISIICEMGIACRALVDAVPCMRGMWAKDSEYY